MFHDLYSSLQRGEDLPDIVPTYLFIATWDQVPEFDRPANVSLNYAYKYGYYEERMVCLVYM